MVEYYNMSQFSTSEGLIGFMKVTSELTKYSFGYALLIIIFIVPLMVLKQKGYDINTAFNFASLITALMGIMFYVGGIVQNSSSIYIPSVIFIITIINKKYSGN